MSEFHPRYRLKLYGQVTSDPDRFAQKAGVLLGISSDAVQALMLNLPVILQKDLAEDRAESLKRQLDALGGLTIIEPVDEPAAESLPVQRQRQASGRDKLREIWSHGDADPEARLYLAVLIGAVVLLSSIITFGYSATLVKLFRQQAPIVANDASHSSKASRLRYDSNSLDSTRIAEIDSRIGELDGRIKMLQSQCHEADMMLQRANTSFSANRGELFERGRDVADLRNKIREAHSEISELRKIRSRSNG